MQVEYKTQKGTVLFVKVPDDATDIKLKDEKLCFRGSLQVGLRQGLCREINKYDCILIGITSDIKEDQAKMMVDTLWKGYMNYELKDKPIKPAALDSFKSLMQHLRVYEVNPLGDFPTLSNFKRLPISMVERKQDRWKEAKSRTGKWIVLFKPE